jgi:hypothetical protein
MTAEEIESRILNELDGQWDRWTSHSLNIRRSLVRPPRRETYISHTQDGEVPVTAWFVLEEAPETHDGYEVFFDEELDEFGLGTRSSDGRRHYLGSYGTLWDVLEGM